MSHAEFVSGLPLPKPMQRLDRDKHQRPIPWFVHREDDGTPDFRVVRANGILDALHFGWCWVCGTPRGRHAAFLVGPMCAVNRTSAEPPSHLDCATYSARACPFMANPGMVRRERGLEEHRPAAGTMILRNPGVGLVWSSRTWSTYAAPGGILFDLGDPTAVSWWAKGAPAARGDVLASIESGLPLLRTEAEKQRGGVEQLDAMTAEAMRLIPA